jgi:hypothetical protein
MISEADIHRAIRLAIKAKQIERGVVIEEEENFGIVLSKEHIGRMPIEMIAKIPVGTTQHIAGRVYKKFAEGDWRLIDR